MKTTQIYNQLPSDTPRFEGVDDVKIKSRENLVGRLKKLINNAKDMEKGMSVISIIGEWGEGKTDTYTRFINPYVESKDDYAFFVSTSTLANLYKNQEVLSVTNKSRLISTKFLSSLFEAVRAEGKTYVAKNISEIDNYSDPEEFVDYTLSNLLKNNDKALFIFLDEFEEILNFESEILRDILSGIKESVNGQYKNIDENGEYEGSVHLILALTPDAVYKFETNEQTNLISGGFLRRLDVVELNEITKKEGIFYLKELLEQSYNNNIPDPYPIENFGLFNTLLRISQKNLGNLRKLFTSLFSNLEIEGKLQVLDYKNLLEFLEQTTVFVFGTQTECIEKDSYYRILSYLQDQKGSDLGELSVEIFKLLIGENRPVTLEYIAEKLEIEEELVLRSIDILNIDFENNWKNDKAVINLAPLKEGKTFEDIRKALERFIKVDKFNKHTINIDDFSEDLDLFMDRITYYKLDNKSNTLISEIFLPMDKDSVRMFFNDEFKSSLLPKEILSRIKDLFENKEYYKLNELILDQIYPSPLPRAMTFVNNKEIRIELWREVLKNLPEYYQTHMPQAFVRCLNQSNFYEIEDLGLDELEMNQNNLNPFRFLNLKNDAIPWIRTLFYSVNGDVKENDIEILSKLLENNHKIHLAVILYSGDVTENASDAISNKGLGKHGTNKILLIHNNPHVSKIMISMERAFIKEIEVDSESIEIESRHIIENELELNIELKNWLDFQLENGLIIEQIRSKHSFTQLADCVKLYLYFLEEPHSPKEIYSKNMESTLKYRIFNQRSGVVSSDFESDKIVSELSDELNDNGFLKLQGSKYRVINHPIENTILDLIEHKPMTPAEISENFLIEEANEKVIKDLFLEILIFKGKLEKNGKKYRLLDINSKYKDLKEAYGGYKQIFSTKDYQNYNHYFVTKQRAEKSLNIEKFDVFITNVYNSLQEIRYNSTMEFSVKVLLCILLIKQLQTFRAEINKATRQSKKLNNEIVDGLKAVNKVFDEIIKFSFIRLNYDFENGKESIKEYKELMSYYNEFKELYADNSFEIIDEIANGLSKEVKEETFSFKMPSSTAFHFNLKYYKLSLLKDNFDEKVSKVDALIKKFKTQFESINRQFTRLQNRLDAIETTGQDRISNYYLERISLSNLESEENKHSFKDIELVNIEKRLKEFNQVIDDKLDNISSHINCVKKTLNEERDLNSLIEDYKSEVNRLKPLFDTENLENSLKKFDSDVSRIHTDFSKIDPSTLLTDNDVEGPAFFIQRWITTLDSKYIKQIKNPWDRFIDENNDYIKGLECTTKTISKSLENPDKFLMELSEIKKINNKELSKQKISAMNIKNKIESIKSEIYHELTKSLEKDEFTLLGIVQALASNSKWVSYKSIEERALTHDFNDERLKKAFKGLVDKKYMQQGYSLI